MIFKSVPSGQVGEPRRTYFAIATTSITQSGSHVCDALYRDSGTPWVSRVSSMGEEGEY